MKTLAAAFLLLGAALPALAQQAPASSQRLEMALNTHVISQIHRSTQVERTLPPPAVRPRPAAEPGSVRMAESVYLDRSLAPRGQMPHEGPAIRVLPRDAR